MPQPNPRQPEPPLSATDLNNPFEVQRHHTYPPLPTPPSMHQRLGVGGYVSWIVIASLTSLLVGTVAFAQFAQSTQVGGDATSGDLMQAEIQSKIIVGQNNLDQILPVPAGQKLDVPLPAEIDDGPYEQRLIFASLKNELEGPESASIYLDSLDEKVEKLQADEDQYDVAQEDRFELTKKQKQLRESMGELLEDYQNEHFDNSDLPEETKTLFKESLGFAGELFLVPPGTPDTKARKKLLSGTAYSIVGVGVFAMLGIMAGLLGFVCSIALVFFALSGKLHSRFTNSASPSGVYIETFAIWMSLFFGCSILLGFLGMDDSGNMIAQPIIFFGSLITLAWPLVRGLTWRQVRQDIGWTIDRPLGDFASAGVSYVSALPCLVPGIIFVAIFMGIMSTFQEPHEFGRMAGPGHPIQEYIANGDTLMLTLVFITACIAAPIVEETMFRGVLYRHLRDLSHRWARWSSIAFSALLNGFIFAAIHPQGIAGIPVLMTLAICFSLTREWRNSLATPMIMHGMHNSLVTCVSLLLL